MIRNGEQPQSRPASSSRWDELDELDVRIIEALNVNGRASMSSLSSHLNRPVGRIKSRYDRLVSRGLLHTVALLDPGALGRPVVAHLTVRTRRGNFALADRLAAVAGVAWIGVGADFETLLVQVSTPNNDALVELINSHVWGDDDTVMVSSAIVLRSWSPTFAVEPRQIEPRDLTRILWRTGRDLAKPLDDVDRELLRCLERDARMTLTEMSKHAGLSVPATRQRLRHLMDDGVVRFRTGPDSRSGAVQVVRLQLQIEGGSSGVVASLAAMPNVNFISESTGDFPVSAEFLCADELQIRDAHEGAFAIPGVVAARMVRFDRILLHTGHW